VRNPEWVGPDWVQVRYDRPAWRLAGRKRRFKPEAGGSTAVVQGRLSVNSEKIVHETVDDEVIIINLDSGTYYSLVDVGLDVWRGVEQGASTEALVDALVERYAADRRTVAEAVASLVNEMVDQEIVRLEPVEQPTKWPDLGKLAATSFRPPKLAAYTNMSDLLLLDPIHDVDEQGWPVRRPD
jgi:hypothetical protein